MDLKLDGKRALVTGSTAGIGAAIAMALAREGAKVIVNGRSPADVEKAVATLKTNPGGDLFGFAGDLGTAQPIEDLVRRHPEVDILVNNMGIFEPKPFEDIPDADWMRFFEVNVMSGVRLSRAYLPVMKRANWGRIIFISSESALQIPAEMIGFRNDQDRADRGRAGTGRERRRDRGSRSIACCLAQPNPAACGTISSRRSSAGCEFEGWRPSSFGKFVRPRSSNGSKRRMRSPGSSPSC